MRKLLVGLLLGAVAVAGASEATVPRWNQAAQAGGHGLDWPLVFLPEDHVAAVRLLHAWNALTPSLPGPGPGQGPGLAVPSLIDLLGADGREGIDPDPAEAVQSWKPVVWGVYQREDRATALALAFPLRAWPEAGVHVLPVPSEAHRDRIQAFVDGRWLAAGHALPPRPVLDAAPALDPARLWWRSGVLGLPPGAYAVLGIALLLLWLGLGQGIAPVLLVPAAAACVAVNLQGAAGADWAAALHGPATGVLPLVLLLLVGAAADWSALLARPASALLALGPLLGILAAALAASALGFAPEEGGALALLAAADAPVAWFVAGRVLPGGLGPIVAATLAAVITWRLVRSLAERVLPVAAEAPPAAPPVSRRALVLFTLGTLVLGGLLLPAAVPVLGALMIGALLRVSGLLAGVAPPALAVAAGLALIALGLAGGAQLTAASVLTRETLAMVLVAALASALGGGAAVLGAHCLPGAGRTRLDLVIGTAGPGPVGLLAALLAAGVLLGMLPS